MQELLLSSCEAISTCFDSIPKEEDNKFWDLKAFLTAIGLLLTFSWHGFSYRQSTKQRRRDKAWDSFKDEIYNPLSETLNELEKLVQPPMLPTQLSGQDATSIGKIFGEHHAKLAAVEVLCERADNHINVNGTNFHNAYKTQSDRLQSSIGKLFSSPTFGQPMLQGVAREYSSLLSCLRDELSKTRTKLNT